jgi:hypothetical protein
MPSSTPLHAAVEKVRLRVVAQQQRAQHRRQGQRHQTGHHDSTRQRQRELGEQAPGTARREGQRRIHRHQRHGHGDDRETHLARTLERRLEGRHALLDVPVDVLQHHDGIVHHQADRQHQRQQRQRVDAETRQRHQAEGSRSATPGSSAAE